jgi:hypothetical protein
MRALRSAPATLVVLALAAVAVVAGLTRPGTPGAAAAALPSTVGSTVRANLLCPDVRQIPGTLSTSVDVGTTTPGSGSVTLAPATSTAAARTVLSGSQGVATDPAAPSGPVVLAAAGGVSGGVVGEQIARANKTSARGWAEARCEPARADQWFLGPATEVGDLPTVVLADPADSRAIVTITVLTPNGLVAAPAGGNLVLAPHSVQRLSLQQLAPGETATAVDVRTESGLVSAAVLDVRTHGTTFLGTDYVPVSEPASTVTVAGLPGSAVGERPARTLSIGNPGTSSATVRVTVTTATGSFVPIGLDALTIPAQSVRSVPLGTALGASAAAVTIASSPAADGTAQPVVAGVLVDASSIKGTGIHEITYLGTVGPLAGPALVPVVITQGDGDPADSDLILAAPTGVATARVVVRTPAGAVFTTRTLTVAAGTSQAYSMRDWKVPNDSSLVVTPLPGSNPLFATRLILEDGALGPLISSFELSGAPPQQQVPAVVPLPLGTR